MTVTTSLFANWLGMAQGRLPWLVLGIGFGVLSISLLVLMLSRLGHARPVQKCVILSVYAHFLLLGFAYMFNLFQDPLPQGQGPGLRVTYIDSDADQDARAGREPWEQSQPISSVASAFPQPHQRPVKLNVPEPTFINTNVDVGISDLPVPDRLSEPKPAAAITTAAPTVKAIDAPSLEPPPHFAEALDHAKPSPAAVAPNATPIQLPSQPESEAARTEDQVQSLTAAETNSVTADLVAGQQDRTKATLAALGAATIVAQTSRAVSRADDGSHGQQRPVLPDLYRARKGDARIEQVLAQGGSRETEQAVQDALAWLAAAQDSRDGRWSTRAWGGGEETRDFSNVHSSSRGIQADTALTGLALLSFFGAGHTHLESPYQETIEKGLQFLFSRQAASNGSLAGNAGPFVAMYCHGIATLAISEAYILTGDKRIRPHLEGAIHFTISSQNRTTGGWRYKPGDAGDTSQFGWQLMSLVSARSAGIEIPEQTWRAADRFLQQVSLGEHGGLACYNPMQKIPSHTMTAEALMCRIFLQGSSNQAAVDEAANYVSQYGLGQAPTNLYYYYYATLALHQLQDHRWMAWNKLMTRKLLSTQRMETGKLRGSWDANTRWGPSGGRVYSTALATLCLESYYRYLPIYHSQVKTANRALANPGRR